ncbi:MAG: hypothetical protein AB8H79_26725 [Myxococcota bacterium]
MRSVFSMIALATLTLSACGGSAAQVGEACEMGECDEGLHCHIESGVEGVCMADGGGHDHSDDSDDSDHTDPGN